MRHVICRTYGRVTRKSFFRVVIGKFLSYVGISRKSAVRFVHIIAVHRVVGFNQFVLGVQDNRKAVAVRFDFAPVIFRVHHHNACRIAPRRVFKHFKLRFRRARRHRFQAERISVDQEGFVHFSVPGEQGIRGVAVHTVTRRDHKRFALGKRSVRKRDEILLRQCRFQRRARHAGGIFRVEIFRVRAVVNSDDFRGSVIDNERLTVRAVRHRSRKFLRIDCKIHFRVIGNGNVLFDHDIFNSRFRRTDGNVRNVIRHHHFTGEIRDVAVCVGNVQFHGVFAGLVAVVAAEIVDIDLQIRNIVGKIERAVIVGNGYAAHHKRAHIFFARTERHGKRGTIFHDRRFIDVRRKNRFRFVFPIQLHRRAVLINHVFIDERSSVVIESLSHHPRRHHYGITACGNRHVFVSIARHGIFRAVKHKTLRRRSYALGMIDVHQRAVCAVSSFDHHTVFRKDRRFSAAARDTEHDTAFGSVIEYAVFIIFVRLVRRQRIE